jgi:hypothetical protein
MAERFFHVAQDAHKKNLQESGAPEQQTERSHDREPESQPMMDPRDQNSNAMTSGTSPKPKMTFR